MTDDRWLKLMILQRELVRSSVSSALQRFFICLSLHFTSAQTYWHRKLRRSEKSALDAILLLSLWHASRDSTFFALTKNKQKTKKKKKKCHVKLWHNICEKFFSSLMAYSILSFAMKRMHSMSAKRIDDIFAVTLVNGFSEKENSCIFTGSLSYACESKSTDAF